MDVRQAQAARILGLGYGSAAGLMLPRAQRSKPPHEHGLWERSEVVK